MCAVGRLMHAACMWNSTSTTRSDSEPMQSLKLLQTNQQACLRMRHADLDVVGDPTEEDPLLAVADRYPLAPCNQAGVLNVREQDLMDQGDLHGVRSGGIERRLVGLVVVVVACLLVVAIVVHDGVAHHGAAQRRGCEEQRRLRVNELRAPNDHGQQTLGKQAPPKVLVQPGSLGRIREQCACNDSADAQEPIAQGVRARRPD
mmetsp:Transcript_113811/g.327060  ORF Transcript_113811/g.327060 Transcript_113811/m.327060 type:complete len:203 (-) Transcript_113811:4-612(-)